jgi:hypothetical protein
MTPDSRSKFWPVLGAAALLALILQSAFLYPRSRSKDAEIEALRAEVAQAQAQHETERGEPRQLAAQEEELTRLRKDNQELHRLRNEVRQLREATQQAAKSPPPTAPAPSAASAELLGQLQRQLQQLQAENAQLRASQLQSVAVQNVAQAQINACINNLRTIDGAKEQWALENRQPAGVVPEPAEIEPYFRDGVIPGCPAQGGYTINAVGLPPLCSIPGHALP